MVWHPSANQTRTGFEPRTWTSIDLLVNSNSDVRKSNRCGPSVHENTYQSSVDQTCLVLIRPENFLVRTSRHTRVFLCHLFGSNLDDDVLLLMIAREWQGLTLQVSSSLSLRCDEQWCSDRRQVERREKNNAILLIQKETTRRKKEDRVLLI